ncbi:MAG TPA: hypothetical protein VFU41_09010 [Gemmatimonadales bacterium]|nr:hypothetical protein [Gemmatimonadales bacterium]
MRAFRARVVLAVLCAGGAAAQRPGVAQAAAGTQRFDHEQHRKLFPACETCHLGAFEAGAPLWPDSASCATCHDGTIEERVSWQPSAELPRTNQRFDHSPAADVKLHPAGKCVDCHAQEGAPWMTVERVTLVRCLDCHEIKTGHLAAPDTACGICHLPLVRAARLTREDIAEFPKPPSHDELDFARGSGHGAAAKQATPVARRCSVCHAREFCLTCHVDAPEQASIQALPSDPRATAIVVRLEPPPSHVDESFLDRHGGIVRRSPAECAACHTRESCQTCHVGRPRVARALHGAEPGRGTGALVHRDRPSSHGENFAGAHGQRAAADAATCAGCHVRADCLDCHRPDAARAAGYHAPAFLARHPAVAYGREASCSDCHNVGDFCTSCHARAGLKATVGLLRSGYHDATRFFVVGHGGAARQSLETCVSCHTERDCLPCHSALGGRRFNPHGPGFDPNRLIKKNPQVCTACHGTAIPTR